MNVVDPLKLINLVWPDVKLYDKQIEILYSVIENDETVVPAGNALGKDYVAALCALVFFLSRRPARVVTTSVKYDQLNDVLWGEIRRFIKTARVNLPIQYNHLHIRQVDSNGNFIPLAELVGQVSSKKEGLLGRHLPRGDFGEPTTLAIFDEASGIDNETYQSTQTWAHRKLIIGNPFPCSNFFYDAVEEGDIKVDGSDRYHRKVIKITAQDSPNVRLAEIQKAKGKEPTREILVPGVKSYDDYERHRKLWDPVLQTIGLDAEFYKGHEILLFPEEWLRNAEKIGNELLGKTRTALSMGVDPAEGGDKSAWCITDNDGIIDLVSLKTPDTTKVVDVTIDLMNRYGVKAENILLDPGGGGKQHADTLRRRGLKVRTISFGEPATDPTISKRMKTTQDRREDRDKKYTYKNRRAEMYGLVRLELERGFGIPTQFMKVLKPQLHKIPLWYDDVGRLELPPKANRDPKSTKPTLVSIIGHSPDESDALALAVFGLKYQQRRAVAGAVKL